MATTDKAERIDASGAQARFVVSLPASVGDQLDSIAQRLSQTLENETGVAFELSRSQVIQALIRQTLTRL